jgi:hypothetical protein
MAETTGSASDLEDLISKFLTWATGTPGWTLDEAINTFDSGRQCALSKGTCFVQMRWDPTLSATSVVALYQSTGYSAATRAGLMTGDSGNGYNTNNSVTSTNLESERCLDAIGNGPFPSYWFYEDGSGDYLHCVVEVATDEFLHFGMGDDGGFDKFADWDTATGGAYCYGHSDRSINSAIIGSTSCLLDGGALTTSGTGDQRLRWATMRMAGMPNQGGSEVWATVGGSRSHGTQFQDTAGNDRAVVMGGFRGGPIPRAFGNFPAGNTSGLAPMSPVACFYVDRVSSPNRAYLIGFMKDVRMVDMTYLAPKDTFTVGADTWRVFPMVRRVEGAAAGDTDFLGIAYKQ